MSEFCPQPVDTVEADDFAELTSESPIRLTGKVGNDPVRDYLDQLKRVPNLTREEEVELSQRIEAGLTAETMLGYLNRQPGDDITDQQRRRDEQGGKLLANMGLNAMTAEQSQSLAGDLEQLAETGQQAKQYMIESNLRLVVSQAKHFQNQGIEFIDLISAGNEGLMAAVEKFDHTLGYKFSTYADDWIKYRIRHTLEWESKPIRLSRPSYYDTKKVIRQVELLHDQTGVAPTVDEVSRSLGLSRDRVSAAQQRADMQPTSLNIPVMDNEGVSSAERGDLLVDDAAVGVDETILVQERDRLLNELLDASLSDIDAYIIRVSYGLGGDQSMTYKDIARHLDMTIDEVKGVIIRGKKTLAAAALTTELVDYVAEL